MGRIIVAKTNEIKPNQIKQVSIDGKDIVVINIDGSYFACKSGKLVKFPAKINDLESYSVVIESDTIFVET